MKVSFDIDVVKEVAKNIFSLKSRTKTLSLQSIDELNEALNRLIAIDILESKGIKEVEIDDTDLIFYAVSKKSGIKISKEMDDFIDAEIKA